MSSAKLGDSDNAGGDRFDLDKLMQYMNTHRMSTILLFVIGNDDVTIADYQMVNLRREYFEIAAVENGILSNKKKVVFERPISSNDDGLRLLDKMHDETLFVPQPGIFPTTILIFIWVFLTIAWLNRNLIPDAVRVFSPSSQLAMYLLGTLAFLHFLEVFFQVLH